MPVLDITIIEDWLLSGGSYSTYTDPARFLKLFLDDETSRTLSAMLAGKADANFHIAIDVIVDTLYELVTLRKTVNTRRKEFFSSYNTPLLMGKEGDKIDGFIAQLSQDSATYKLETFKWTTTFSSVSTLFGVMTRMKQNSQKS